MTSRFDHRKHHAPDREQGFALWTLGGVALVIGLLAAAATLDDPQPSDEEIAASERAFSMGVAEGRSQERLARAQAVKVEMENFRRMNELQVTSQVEGLMQGLVVMMKSSLEGLPGRLSGELAGINDAPEIYNRLQSELRSICALCADYLDKQADALAASEEPREDDAAVAEDDTGELGQGESDDAGGQSGAGKVPAGADAIHDSPA